MKSTTVGTRAQEEPEADCGHSVYREAFFIRQVDTMPNGVKNYEEMKAFDQKTSIATLEQRVYQKSVSRGENEASDSEGHRKALLRQIKAQYARLVNLDPLTKNVGYQAQMRDGNLSDGKKSESACASLKVSCPSSFKKKGDLLSRTTQRCLPNPNDASMAADMRPRPSE